MRETYQAYFSRERAIRSLVRRSGAHKSRIKALAAELMSPRRRDAPGLIALPLSPEQAARLFTPRTQEIQ